MLISPSVSIERIVCSHMSRDFKVDGDIGKTAWVSNKWIKFDQHAYSDAKYPHAATRVAALWTPRSIYFGFECKYSKINVYTGEDTAHERWELWNRDVVEVFINPRPDSPSHYYEFEVAPNNQWIDLEIDKTKNPFYDPAWNSGFEHATHIDDQYWSCEMRIPIASMGVQEISVGEEWRLNFFRADGPGEPERCLMAWSMIPGGSSFHTPSCFGIIHFSA